MLTPAPFLSHEIVKLVLGFDTSCLTTSYVFHFLQYVQNMLKYSNNKLWYNLVYDKLNKIYIVSILFTGNMNRDWMLTFVNSDVHFDGIKIIWCNWLEEMSV